METISLNLNINRNKLPFFFELINNFDFVKIEAEDIEPSKEEILASIKQGLEEVKLIEQGKLKSKPLKQFLNELQN